MNQVKTGAVLNYLIIGLNALVGLLYTPYMLRMLGQNQYGLYSLVASIIAYLTLLDFGFGPTVVRYTAKYRAEGRLSEQYSLFGLFLTLYSVIGIVAFIVGLMLYFNIDRLFDHTMTIEDLNQARVMILLLLFNLAFTFPMSIFGSIITAYEKFIFQKTLLILRIVLSTAVLVAILYLGYKAVAMVIVQTSFNVTLLILNLLYCKNKLKIELKFERFRWSFVRELLSFSIWVFLGDIMFKFYYNTGQFVLGAISGTNEISLFAVGVTLMTMYMMFSSGISGVLLPKVTKMIAMNKSDKDISDLFIRTGRLQFIILGLIIVGFVALGRPFIYLWAGETYSAVYIIALVLFISTFIPLIQNVGILILQARNRQKFRALILLTVGAVSLVAQIVLSKYYGAIGCAVAIGIANIIGNGVIMNWYYAKFHNIDMFGFWKEIVKLSVVPVILAVSGYLCIDRITIHTWTGIITGGIVIVATYFGFLWLFGLNSEEKRMLALPFSKLYKILSR